MPRNGSGTYTLPAGNPVVTGTTISSSTHNTTMSDIADALTASVAKDGQTVMTGALDMNGNEIVLDADGDTSWTSDTDDIADLKVAGTDALKVGWQKVTDTGFWHLDPGAVTLDAGENGFRAYIGNTNAITVPAGTTTTVATLALTEPNITATGTLTNAATLYIPGAPTEGSNNYAVWVDAGEVQIDGNLTVNGNINQGSSAFSAYVGTTLTDVTGDGTNYDVVFNTERADSESDYNTGTGIFTAPLDGLYCFQVQLELDDFVTDNTTILMYLVTSNHTYIWFTDIEPSGASSNEDTLPVNFSVLVDMDASDTAKVQIDVAGTTKGIDVVGASDSRSFFSGFLQRST